MSPFKKKTTRNGMRAVTHTEGYRPPAGRMQLIVVTFFQFFKEEKKSMKC